MVSREVEFARSLERVRRIAREQGNTITREQVVEELAGLSLEEAQLQMVFDYLTAHHVGIGETVDPDAFLTEEERDYLQQYLDALEALPVCSAGEREAYAMSAMAGDADARLRLTESCLRDVAEIARLYTGQGVQLEDLIGEGNVALAAGVEQLGGGEFVPKPSEVHGMLAERVMDAMEELIRENSDMEKKDKRLADKVNRVADKARELAEELHRKVRPEELVQETDLSLRAVRDAMRMSGYRIEDIEYAEDGL